VVFEIAKETKDRLEADIALDISVNNADLRWTTSKYNINSDSL
jgi:hypothetical protein